MRTVVAGFVSGVVMTGAAGAGVAVTGASFTGDAPTGAGIVGAGAVTVAGTGAGTGTGVVSMTDVFKGDDAISVVVTGSGIRDTTFSYFWVCVALEKAVFYLEFIIMTYLFLSW